MGRRVIETGRLCLGPIRPDDRAALIGILADSEVGRTYMTPELDTEEKRSAVFGRLRGLSESDGRFVYGIFLEGRLIGMIHEVAKTEDWIELGYFISPAEKNRGYATEALKAAVAELFSMGVPLVKAGAFPNNAASLRVMEKSGMVRTDETETVEYRGEKYECVFCAIRNPAGSPFLRGGNR